MVLHDRLGALEGLGGLVQIVGIEDRQVVVGQHVPRRRLEDTEIDLLGFFGFALQLEERAQVEVDIIFSDGDAIWSVVAISENINKASFMALLDGFEYAILSKETA